MDPPDAVLAFVVRLWPVGGQHHPGRVGHLPAAHGCTQNKRTRRLAPRNKHTFRLGLALLHIINASVVKPHAPPHRTNTPVD